MYKRFLSGFSGLVLICVSARGQQKVDTRHTYERLFCVISAPLIGKGTLDDPKRPMYAPAPRAMNPASGTGILSFQYQMSDDGKTALVEFVARDRSAFAQIQADTKVKSFLKGKDSATAIQAEFTLHKKNFTFDGFAAATAAIAAPVAVVP
jgi:hypothetical protein